MEEVKELYSFAVGMGWDPKVFVLVAAALLAGRRFLEPNIIDILTVKDKSRLAMIRLGLFFAAWALGWLAQVGFHQEVVHAVNFVYGAGDAIIGWVFYSLVDSIVGVRFSKAAGGDNAPNP